MRNFLMGCLMAWAVLPVLGETIDFQAMLDERSKTVAILDYSIQSEEERDSQIVVGLVVDAEAGLILLANGAIPSWVPPTDIVEMKVFLPGNSEDEYAATYQGYDHVTKWHTIVVEESAREQMRSIGDFEMAELALGERLWGVGVQPNTLNYVPYLLQATKSLRLQLPWTVDVAQGEIGAPGAPVFDMQGRWLGICMSSLSQNFTLRMAGRTFPSSLTNDNESSIMLTASEVMKHLERADFEAGSAASGWLGVVGMQPVEKAVTDFLNLGDQGGIVITDIVEASAAAQAGFEGRDIIVSVNGEALPKRYPLDITIRDFEMAVSSFAPGDVVTFGVMRGEELVELEATLLDRPQQFRDVERTYFKELGFSVRQKLLSDGFARRSYSMETEGAIVRFVRENSTAHAAGMQRGDWIMEINGDAVSDYETALALLESIQAAPVTDEYVVLVDRAGETQILRIKR